MSTLLEQNIEHMTDLNEEVRADRFYCNNLPDVPVNALLQLPYWIHNASDGGYNLYYWDHVGNYKVRHFHVVQEGKQILNGNGGPYTSLESFVSSSYAQECYGEEMGTDLLPAL